MHAAPKYKILAVLPRAFVVGLTLAGFIGLAAQAANTPPAGATQTTSLPAPTAWQIAGHGTSSRVWQRTVYEPGPGGKAMPRIHQYTELATGMYYQDAGGQWQESKDEIDAYAQGAVAQKGPYSVIFANNLNTAGSIDQQTPDGKRLRSNILGLVYHDTASGDDVLIGQVQDSTGQLISANQALYTNAFSGVNADVRYTYKKGSFEQDVILRAQPPAPESYGLSSATTELEVMTEFLNPPQETTKEHAGPKGAEPDQDISWGAMRIGPGKAFDLGKSPSRHSRVSVTKQYVTIQGRKILLEKVPLSTIQTSLRSLPLHASIKPKLLKTASKKLVLPQPLLAQATGKPMKLAASSPSNQGYVLDYVELNTDQSDFTFQADTTYLVDGSVNLSGTTTFEGETVIKEDQNGQINIDSDGTIVCSTGPYRPAIFTSINDDSVGESGADTDDPYYTGSPNYVDVLTYLNLSCSSPVLSNMRFCYAQVTVNVPEGIGGICFWDCQFVQIDNAIDTIDTDVNLRNVLFNEIIDDNPIWILSSGNFTAENVTSDGYVDVAANVNILVYVDNPGTQSVALTNCLVTQIDPNNGMYEVSFDGANFTESSTPTYQTVGAGSYYLANGSPYRNAGTTNIDPALLADLATKTTWPPIVYDGISFTTPTTLSPSVQRDTSSSPDLGYHYDSMDYVFGGCDLSTSLTLTAGTAAGWFEDSGGSGTYGIGLADGATFTATGTATAPCWVPHFDMVQEGNGSWLTHGYIGDLAFNGSGSAPLPQLDAQFTKWSGPIAIGGYFRGNGAGTGQFQDCEFYGSGYSDYGASLFFTNCLFLRGGAVFNYDSLAYQNCTFYNGLLAMARYSYLPATWLVKNTAFDGTALFTYDELGGDTNYTAIDYNAYNTNNLSWETYPWPYPPIYGTLGVIGAHDITNLTAFNWQTSWLGNFYLPPDSPLIDAGSTPADQAGLYEFTTQTNQTEEADSIVDIGYHYVATDAYGNPLETLTNNAPDYLVDANGNGLPDAWEFYWFGNYTNTANELDGSGNTLLADYDDGTTPDVISFTVNLGNQHFNTTNATGSYLVQGGIPSYEAVLVNDTNLNDAVWTNYDGTVHLDLGATDGVYQVWIGLKCFASDATSNWMGTTVYVDRVAPVVIINSPTTNVVAQPIIQLQGCSPESLLSVTYDLSNAVVVVTNQPGQLLGGQCFDTNTFEYTTDYFQCYDLPLTNGLNTVTIHATDLAGNLTVTNFNYTLDYSTATNPVVCLTWPQNGMQICQTNFTLRGWVNDSTATVTASIMDTNGDTNVVGGMVERTGVLWVEDLPLAEGTNVLTLSVTNAAGLSSVTNINIVKSDMTLALTSIDGDLWQPTVNVSGVISDTNAPVWVNGMQGTNNGDGTWSAANVPVSSSGVASFDMSTIPPGGSDSTSNTNANKPAEIVIESAHWSLNHLNIAPGGESEDDTESNYYGGDFSITNGGVYTSIQDAIHSNGVCYLSSSLVDTLAPDQSIPLEHDFGFEIGVPNWDYYLTNVGSITIPQEEGGLSCGVQGATISAAKSSKVKMTLHTGGKDGSGRESLFALTATAAPELALPNFVTGGTSFLPTQITVDGQTLGSDSIRWKVYQDGSSPDVTPIAQSSMYSFTVGQTKYKPYVQVNSVPPLQPDHVTQSGTFCVGEDMNFAPLWRSSTPPYVNDIAHWTLPGNYVNDSWQDFTYDPFGNINYYGSVNYDVNSDLLAYETTSCWYVDKLTAGTASVGMSLQFANGQTVSIVAAGQFNIFRPSLVDFQTPPPAPAICLYNVSGDWRLGVGNASGVGDIDYQVYVNSTFSVSQFFGQAGIMQTFDDQSVPVSDGSNILDGAGWYPNPNPSLTTVSPTFTSANKVGLIDGPWEKCNDSITNTTALELQFSDYARFMPSAGPGPNIYVTLGKLTWNVNAHASYSSGVWILDPTSTVSGPYLDSSSTEFPFWTSP